MRALGVGHAAHPPLVAARRTRAASAAAPHAQPPARLCRAGAPLHARPAAGRPRLASRSAGSPRRLRRTLAAAASSDDAPGGGSGPFRTGDVVREAPDAAVGYRVESVLGSGSSSHVYVCSVERDGGADAPGAPAHGERVALKALSLRGMGAWKNLDLIERESRTLQGLEHPGVPALLSSFTLDSDRDRTYVLVLRLAPGDSLQTLVDGGAWRPDDAEIEAIALRLLEIVTYLHERRPPVVHRDIKPANIVYERSSGAVNLVDFGAVRDTVLGGSTMIGTFGYFPPEQFLGKTTPASDMYAIGTTLLLLLTGRPPSDLPQRGLRIEWEKEVNAGPRLRALLAGVLRTEPEDRLDAAEALAVLRGEASNKLSLRNAARNAVVPAGRRRRPIGTDVIITRDGTDSITVDVPPSGFSLEVLIMGGFTAAWLGIVSVWTTMAIVGGAPLFFTAFSIPFWAAGVFLAKDTAGKLTVSFQLRFERTTWAIKVRAVRGIKLRSIEGDLEDLDAMRIANLGSVNDTPVLALELIEGVRKTNFGLGLSLVELEWIATELQAYLRDVGVDIPVAGPDGRNLQL